MSYGLYTTPMVLFAGIRKIAVYYVERKATDPMDAPLFNNEQVDLTALPAAAEVDWTPLQQAYLQVNLISLWLTRLAILAVFLVVTAFQEDFPFWLRWSIAGAWMLFLLISTLLTYYGFKIKGYAIREHDLMYRTGLIFRKVTVIPYNRIQHSEMLQGVVERQFNLSRLAVFTAGGSQSDLTIPGLTRERAEQMRSWLSKKVEADEEE